MSGYHLCQVRKAEHPYYIESISTNIYTIEELCFYLQQNIYLVDSSIMNEELCSWVGEELGLKKLCRKLTERLEEARHGSMAGFLLPIFKEIGYLSPEEHRQVQEQISGIEIPPADLRRKIKADYLMKYGMYGNAIREYCRILKDRNPGNLGIQFYASVLDSMAAGYGHLFLFEEAADCLWQSYGIVKSAQTLNRYLSVLPLFLDKEAYRARLQEISVTRAQIDRIETKNAKYIREEVPKLLKAWDAEKFLEQQKKEYCKSACS